MSTTYLLSMSIGEHGRGDYKETPLMVFQDQQDAMGARDRIVDIIEAIEQQYENWIKDNKKLSHEDRWEYHMKGNNVLEDIINNGGLIEEVSKKDVFVAIHYYMGYAVFITELRYLGKG